MKQDSFPASHFPPPTENASPLKLLAKINISGGAVVILKFTAPTGNLNISPALCTLQSSVVLIMRLPLLFSLLTKCVSICVHWLCEERKGACKRGPNFRVDFPRI